MTIVTGVVKSFLVFIYKEKEFFLGSNCFFTYSEVFYTLHRIAKGAINQIISGNIVVFEAFGYVDMMLFLTVSFFGFFRPIPKLLDTWIKLRDHLVAEEISQAL